MQGRDSIQTTEAKNFKRKHLRYKYVLKSPSAQGIYTFIYLFIHLEQVSQLS